MFELRRTLNIVQIILYFISGLERRDKVIPSGQVLGVSIPDLKNNQPEIVLLSEAGTNGSLDKDSPQYYNVDLTDIGALGKSSKKKLKASKSQDQGSLDVLEWDNLPIVIHGFRIEKVNKGVSYEDAKGISSILADSLATIRFFGKGLTNRTVIRFVTQKAPQGSSCDGFSSTKEFPVTLTDLGFKSGTAKIKLPSLKGEDEAYYICTRENIPGISWTHQGSEDWMKIKAHHGLLPFWSQCLAISVLLLLSGLFAGLTLGLLALDRTDLQILANTGTKKEQMYAKTIIPLRTRGNYLLCSLVLGNVLVNSTLTILLDDLTSGLIAVITSTTGIVLIGEIIPQAICSRNGLAIGAKTVWLTKFLMLVTFPLSFAISFVLDKILGEEIGSVYTRERLKELLKVTKDHHGLEKEEVAWISGALDMKTKTVRHIMTNLEAVFMLPLDSKLDYDTVSEIEFQGFTRIPVYEKSRSNVVAVLNVKQLTLLDPSDNIPIRTVVEYYQNSIFYVFENTRLDYMFRTFREGNRGHMAFVQRINDVGPGDPFYETIGLVTMEDVLEELLQQEILDETDGKFRKRVEKKDRLCNLPFYSKKRPMPAISVPPPLALAACQFLSTAVPAFHRNIISDNILNRLVETTIRLTKPSKFSENENSETVFLFECGKPSDVFIMVLEGRVEVQVGKENLTFQAGPFQCFGAEFLLTKPTDGGVGQESFADAVTTQKHCFIPDYSVRVVGETFYMKVSFSLYCAAKVATELETKYSSDPTAALTNENWRKEVEDILTFEDQNLSIHHRRMEENTDDAALATQNTETCS